jgi:hypothetical protein
MAIKKDSDTKKPPTRKRNTRKRMGLVQLDLHYNSSGIGLLPLLYLLPYSMLWMVDWHVT